jgi:hypothetical protein
MVGIARGGVPGRRRGSRGWRAGKKANRSPGPSGKQTRSRDELMDEAHEDWAWSSTWLLGRVASDDASLPQRCGSNVMAAAM